MIFVFLFLTYFTLYKSTFFNRQELSLTYIKQKFVESCGCSLRIYGKVREKEQILRK